MLPNNPPLVHAQSDPGDAFNQFWNIMQGMLDNLSQPVAFATAPLGNPDIPEESLQVKSASEPRRDGSLSSDTDADEPIFSKFTRRIGISREGTKTRSTKSSQKLAGSSKPPSSPDNDILDDDDDFFEDGSSFCVAVAMLKLSLKFFDRR